MLCVLSVLVSLDLKTAVTPATRRSPSPCAAHNLTPRCSCSTTPTAPEAIRAAWPATTTAAAFRANSLSVPQMSGGTTCSSQDSNLQLEREPWLSPVLRVHCMQYVYATKAHLKIISPLYSCINIPWSGKIIYIKMAIGKNIRQKMFQIIISKHALYVTAPVYKSNSLLLYPYLFQAASKKNKIYIGNFCFNEATAQRRKNTRSVIFPKIKWVNSHNTEKGMPFVLQISVKKNNKYYLRYYLLITTNFYKITHLA